MQDESEYVNCAVFFQLVTMLIRNFLLLARIPDGPDLAPSVTGLSQDPEKALSTAGHVSLAVCKFEHRGAFDTFRNNIPKQ